MGRRTGRRIAAGLAFALALSAQACGARTELDTPEGAGGASASSATGVERTCLPNCTVGHECCVGGCGGPPAVTLNDCCACLPGEVDSNDCPDDVCGG